MTLALRRFARPPDSTVAVPGSKSIANRMLICAALSQSETTITGVPDGDDTASLLGALGQLGLVVEHLDPHTVRMAGRLAPTGGVVNAGLAGTSSRFLLALCALGDRATTIDGAPPLRQRPMSPLLGALRSLGANVDAVDDRLPASVSGPLRGGTIRLLGDVSSQFISALMMVGPRLEHGLVIEVEGELVSRPYVEMTASVMGQFGHDDVHVADDVIRVAPGSYVGGHFVVEPDASSASYPLAIAALTGGRIRVPGLGQQSLQGDAAIASLLAELGCSVSADDFSTTITGPIGGRLTSFDLQMTDISDLVPTFAILATQCTGPCHIRGVGFIRAKESNRLGVLTEELNRLGGQVTETADGLHISPSSLHGGVVRTHHDHRIAMAFGVLSSVIDGITVEDPDVVSKSWPGFWSMMDGLRS